MVEAERSVLSTQSLLRECLGCPVRVTLLDPIYRERLGRFPGILAKVLLDSVSVECLDVPPSVPAHTSASLELAHQGRFYWCHSQLLPGLAHQPHFLRLEWPERLQTVQQRTWPRVETYVPVHFFVGGGAEPQQGVIVDISAGGAALQGSVPIDPGQRIALVFALGTGLFFQSIEAEAVRVAASRRGVWTVGLRFVGMTAEQELHLNGWVDERRRHDPGVGI